MEINNLYDHIRKAAIEAEKRYIEANTIFIDKHVAYTNNLWIEDNLCPPMIFGLEMKYAEKLPNNANFMMSKVENHSTKFKKELGIDIEIVIRAINEGIYLKGEHFKRPRLYYSDDFNCYCFELAFGAYVVKLQDYDITWTIDNEEE